MSTCARCEDIRWTLDGLVPAGCFPPLAPAMVFPPVDLRAGESVVAAVDFPAGRPLGRRGVPDADALLAVLGGIVVEGKVARWAARGFGV